MKNVSKIFSKKLKNIEILLTMKFDNAI